MCMVNDKKRRAREAAIEDTCGDLAAVIVAQNACDENILRPTTCKQQRQRAKAADNDAFEPARGEHAVSKPTDLSHWVENDKLHVTTSRSDVRADARASRVRRLIDTFV